METWDFRKACICISGGKKNRRMFQTWEVGKEGGGIAENSGVWQEWMGKGEKQAAEEIMRIYKILHRWETEFYLDVFILIIVNLCILVWMFPKLELKQSSDC